MIGKLLATTAFATVLATGAFAQDNTTAAPAADAVAAPAENNANGQVQNGEMKNSQMPGWLASNLIGESVYTSARVQAAQDAAEGQAADGQTIVNSDANNQMAQDGQQSGTSGQTMQADQAAQNNGQTTQADTNAQNGQAMQGDQNGQTAQNNAAAAGQRTGDNIGEVNDVVIGPDGKVEAIVVGVGGFLGIGEKNVALKFDALKWQQDGTGDQWIVVDATKESLEALPDFDRSGYEPTAADSAMNNDGGAAGDVAATGAGVAAATGAAVNGAADATAGAAQDAGNAVANTADNATDAAGNAVNNAGNAANTAMNNAASGTGTTNTTDATQTTAIDRSQLQEIPQNQMTAETLVGTTVYGANDENIGEIGDIVLTQDGKVDAVLVDVGGFLGIGEKRVAVGMDKLQFLQDGNGNRYLYTNFTADQLNAQAAYDEGTYSQSRDQQRLIVQ